MNPYLRAIQSLPARERRRLQAEAEVAALKLMDRGLAQFSATTRALLETRRRDIEARR